MKAGGSLRIWVSLLAAAMVVLGFLALHDWCKPGPAQLPSLSASAEGALFAGGSRVELHPPYPVVIAGYGPPRPTARRATAPLHARALVLQVGTLKVGLVAVDLLLIPQKLVHDIRASVKDLGLAHLWVVATHAHSSMGGYDSSLLSQVAGTGLFRRANAAAVVAAASQAVREAGGALAPADLEVGEGFFRDLVSARSEGAEPDGRLTRIALKGEKGAIGQWLIFAAHPTLVPRPAAELNPDYPGLVSQREEELGQGVTLVTQGALGNVSAAAPGPDPQRAAHYATRLEKAIAQVSVSQVRPVRLAVSITSTELPRPDASRIVPALISPVASGCLCLVAPRRAEISELHLGPLRLVFMPGELTAGAEKLLQSALDRFQAQAGSQARADATADGGTHAVGGASHQHEANLNSGHSVALTDGYIGYVEDPSLVQLGLGESKRQYFGPELARILEETVRRMSEGTPHDSTLTAKP